MRLLRRIQCIMAAILLLVVLCVAGAHEASAAHSDQHAREHCAICTVIQSIRSTDLTSPVIVPSPVLVHAVPYLIAVHTTDFVSEIFQTNAPTTGPPV